jgi:ABC-type antimicrobial peptide transport system permease subunit
MTGIYGMTAFIVGRRSRELGVRLALGATNAGIVWLVLGHIAVRITAGAVLGVAGAMMTNGLLSAAAPDAPKSGDGMALIVGSALLIVTALASALGPALRAARIDPKVALQAE